MFYLENKNGQKTKKSGKVLLVFLMCFGLFGCGGSKKDVAEIEKELKKTDIESYVFKYEFKREPSIAVRDSDLGGANFNLGKKAIELKQCEKDFDDDGGISFYYVGDEEIGLFRFNKEKVIATTESSDSKQGQKKLDQFLKKADMTQEELFNYIVDYGKENLFKETKEDTLTTKELIKENDYTYDVKSDSLFISDANYVLATAIENDKITSAILFDKTNSSVMFTVPYTSTLGNNIFFISDTKTFYDMDKDKVISGKTVTDANIEDAKKLKEKCYDMLRNLHITTPNELKEVYKELTK